MDSNPLNIRQQEREGYDALPPRSIFLYGVQKSGKTTAAAGWPGVLIMNFLTENGTEELHGASIVDYQTPAEVVKILNWFAAGKHEYFSITWDGFTNFVLETAQKAERESKSNDKRRAYADATADILPLISQFNGLRKYHRVITGHARWETNFVDVKRVNHQGQVAGTWNGIPVKKISPDLPPRIGNYLLGFLDAYGFCYRNPKGERVVRWQPINPPLDETFQYKPSEFKELEAGSRLPLPTLTPLSFTGIENAVIKESKKS